MSVCGPFASGPAHRVDRVGREDEGKAVPTDDRLAALTVGPLSARTLRCPQDAVLAVPHDDMARCEAQVVGEQVLRDRLRYATIPPFALRLGAWLSPCAGVRLGSMLSCVITPVDRSSKYVLTTGALR